jgi:DNA invertase Pin-like site-specific DNA recombinase
MFQMCGVFAEFERAIIVDRVMPDLRERERPASGMGRGDRKDGQRSADEERWEMYRAELEKRVLRLYEGPTGILKIGKELGVGTATVQRAQPRPFEASASA